MSVYLLDTDISSYIIKERPASVLKNLEKHASETIGISVVTYAELIYGVERSASKKINRSIVENFVQRLFVYPWEHTAAKNYALILTSLEKLGNPIGNMDMMIAAHAKALKATLVTNNNKHFKKISNLKLQNWV